MLEEKWYKPKSIEQLEKEEKDRQFRLWIVVKCKDIINYYSCENSDYDRNYEKDGYMVIEAYTKSAYDSCRFSETYRVPINEFWDFNNVVDMKVERIL
jgi:hypothetical protein